MLLCEHVHEDPVIHFSDTGCTASPVEYYFHQRYNYIEYLYYGIQFY